MKKTLLTISILIISLVIAYSQDERLFPAELNNLKSDAHVHAERTNIYLLLPKEYKYIESLSRFEKEERLYLSVTYLSSSPKEVKEDILRPDIPIYYEESLLINGKEAIYLEVPATTDGETKIILIVGDSTSSTKLLGLYENNNKSGKIELLEIIKTIYYESEIKLDPFDLVNYTLDLNITSFKLESYSNLGMVFYLNGVKETDDLDNPGFTVFSFPKLTEEKAKEIAKMVFLRSETDSKAKFISKDLQTIIINGRKAFVYESEIDKDGLKGWINQTFILDENSCLIFVGSTFSEIEDYKNKYRLTIKSFKEKLKK